MHTSALVYKYTIEQKRQYGMTNNDGSDQNGPWKQSNRKFDK